MIYPKLLNATGCDDYTLLLEYDDGQLRRFDFKPHLGHKFYRELTKIELFKQVQVTDGEIEWASGQDFCPNTLYEKSVPEVFYPESKE